MKTKVGLMAAVLLLFALPWLCAQEPESDLTATAKTASAVPADTAQATAPQLQQRDSRYRLAANDSFDVNFELSPEFNQTVTVQPDGYVTLKAVGDVKVAGETVPELTQTLRTAYGKILNDPMIAVVLKDFEKPYFVADGQVAHPGKYEMRGTITLTEAVAIAGGFTENAKHSQVLLFRRVNDQWLSAKIFNIKDMEKRRDLHEDPTLHPGDMLIVPKNALSKIKPFIPNAGMGAYKQIP
ncbi:MAG: polysaccharide biosynthesis/export family protein [Candidatus Sulfotelmatobacter sp.]